MSTLTTYAAPEITYALEINGNESRLQERVFFVDALHDAYQAIQQGAMRVVLIQVATDEGLELTPLCVLTPWVAS